MDALLMNDDRVYVETLHTSLTGATIVRASGSVSVLSSIILIVIILRSTVGLSSTYHRIMFGMSIADVVSSTAMALTTLPMPKDMIYTQFEVLHIGNTQTCEAQGFFAMQGNNAAFLYNVGLCVYYFFSIWRKMTDDQIRKCIEPVIHLCCILIPTVLATCGLLYDTINPSPYHAWCTVTFYPWFCTSKDRETCALRGTDFRIELARYIACIVYAMGFVIIVLSLSLITLHVYRKEKAIIREEGRYKAAGGRSMRLALSRSCYKSTKATLAQASAYILSLFICQGNIFIHVIAPTAVKTSRLLQIYHLITKPSQGFFTLLIFVVHKVHNLRRIQPDLSFCQASYMVFTNPYEPYFYFSGMSMVINNGVRPSDVDVLVYDDDDDDDSDEESKTEEELGEVPEPLEESVTSLSFNFSTGVSEGGLVGYDQHVQFGQTGQYKYYLR